MAIIIVLVLLWRTGAGDGTAVFVVVAAPPLREAVVEYPIALPVVAVAATEVVVPATEVSETRVDIIEVSDTRGDMVGVEARLDMDW